MKRMKKIIVTILSLAMMMGLCVTVNAAESDQNYNEIYYTVYNENGEVVDEGIIPRTTNARYHWSPNITLNNGWYTSFRMPGPNAFYITSNTAMKFSYSLNRSATIKYQFMKSSQRSTPYADVWKTGTITAENGSVTKTADSTAYYYVGITNASSDAITITSVNFTF